MKLLNNMAYLYIKDQLKKSNYSNINEAEM